MQTLNKPRMLSQARFFELPLCEKYPNTEFFSGAYFPVFSPNTGKTDQEKLRIWTRFTQCSKMCTQWAIRHFLINMQSYMSYFYF